jgi:hypothetical protein
MGGARLPRHHLSERPQVSHESKGLSVAPPLPLQVSPDGRELWSWAGDFGAHLQREARAAELRRSIRECGASCGDCEKWMKSRECPRERPGTGARAGYSVGPSMNDSKCGEFIEKSWITKRRAELTAELESLSGANAQKGRA